MATQEIEKAPELYIETLTKGDSGYISDDSKGSDFEDKIDCPSITFLPNTGYISKEIVDPISNKATGRYRNVAVRYIKNCPVIEIEEQDKLGWEKAKQPSADTITVLKGKAIIKREGDIALYDYLKNVFWNVDAPNRPKGAKGLFKVVEVEQKVKVLNENKFLQARALMQVEKLVIKTGNSYKYQENKIDNILTAISKHGGDNYSDAINVLTNFAEKHPEKFLDVVSHLENVTVTLVSHALELSVIRFDGFTAEYIDGKSILATVGNENKSADKKMIALSDLLKTPEYAQAYQELVAKVDIAKEKELTA